MSVLESLVRLIEIQLQLNLSTTDTLGQKKVAVVERFKQESMYGLSAKKLAVPERWPTGRCGEVAVSRVRL